MTPQSSATLARGTTSASDAGGSSGFRTDIQALRALAVSLVVLNHLWPARLTGGYVGVDVFFVISGFLITSHLTKELMHSGRIRLSSFYARRVRRLMPAALSVLAFVLVGVWVFLPFTRWTEAVHEVIGSIFYVENWLLAARAVDYSAMNQSATVVQHYWSLSVEEQFYLAWPVVLILLALAARCRGWRTESVLFLGVCTVGILSLIYSTYFTFVAPNQAYFATPVRVWEFCLGAIVAQIGLSRKMPRFLRNVVALLGLVLIFSAALKFDKYTSFPSWTALLPAGGAALVIFAGSAGTKLWHDRVSSARVVQFIGNVSYSLYLWHWPLIVMAPFVLRSELSTLSKTGVLVLAILLAWVTKGAIEDRWLTKKTGARLNRKTFLSTLTAMIAITLAALGLSALAGQKEEATKVAAASLSSGPCYGPNAVDEQGCADPFAQPVAQPDMGTANEYFARPADCPSDGNTLRDDPAGSPTICDFSAGTEAPKTVWLVGDSHAQQWQAAVFELARRNHWILKWSYFGACPIVDARYVGYEGQAADPATVQACERWSRAVVRAIEADAPARVFVSMYASGEKIDDGTARGQVEQFRDGLRRDWQRLVNLGIRVSPIYDPPLNAPVRNVDCLSLNADDPLTCAADTSLALPDDPMRLAVEAMASPLVNGIDMTKYFCRGSECFAAVGGVPIYFDKDHLNKELVELLVPEFQAHVDGRF